MNHKEKDTQSIFRTFAKYVSLNVIGMIGLSCYILADTIFIANGLGNNGLTALNLILPVFSFLNGLGLMFGMGAATRYSILRGEHNEKKANQVFTQILIIALIAGTILTAVGIFFPFDIAAILGADPSILPMAGTYLQTILVFSYAFLINNVMICFVRNDGNPKLAMTAMLAGSFSNIVLDYIFIFEFDLGMFGAAFATGLAPIISLGVLSLHFIKKKNNVRLAKTSLPRASVLQMLSLGLPSFITEFSSGIIMLLFNFTILSIAGNTGVAAYGIIANLALIVVAVLSGIAQGIQPLLSTSYGEGKTDQMKVIHRLAIILSVVLGCAFYVVCFIFPESITSLFNREQDALLTKLASEGMRLYFVAFLFMGANIVTSSFFASIEKPMQSFVISIIRGFVAVIPLILIMPILFQMTGVWLVIPIVEIITLCISISIILAYSKPKTVK